MTTKLNKRERRAQQLLAHYATCERLARHLGMTAECPKCGLRSNNTTCPKCVVPMRGGPDGKKISVALWKAEQAGQRRSMALCNDENYTRDGYERSEADKEAVVVAVCHAFKRSHKYPPPGFFVNGDPRGYALKIDNATLEGRALIAAVGLHTDWGGYGILSPEITGD